MAASHKKAGFHKKSYTVRCIKNDHSRASGPFLGRLAGARKISL